MSSRPLLELHVYLEEEEVRPLGLLPHGGDDAGGDGTLVLEKNAAARHQPCTEIHKLERTGAALCLPNPVRKTWGQFRPQGFIRLRNHIFESYAQHFLKYFLFKNDLRHNGSFFKWNNILEKLKFWSVLKRKQTNVIPNFKVSNSLQFLLVFHWLEVWLRMTTCWKEFTMLGCVIYMQKKVTQEDTDNI
jgi:hypothetical protein